MADGVGGPLGVAAGANVFLGMVEAPLLIRPYLGRLSELSYRPVFVLGEHRSGTTILYELLARSGSFNYLTAYHTLYFDQLLAHHVRGTTARAREDLRTSAPWACPRDSSTPSSSAPTTRRNTVSCCKRRAAAFDSVVATFASSIGCAGRSSTRVIRAGRSC